MSSPNAMLQRTLEAGYIENLSIQVEQVRERIRTINALGRELSLSSNGSDLPPASALVRTLEAMSVLACWRSSGASPTFKAMSAKILWRMLSSRLSQIVQELYMYVNVKQGSQVHGV